MSKAVNVHEARNRDRILLVLYTSKNTWPGFQTSKDKKSVVKTHLEVCSSDDTTRVASKRYLKDCHFCPVSWVLKFIKMRPPIMDTNEQLFIFQDRSPLLAHHLRDLLRSILENLQLEKNFYDTHSFRIGRGH